MEDYRLEQSGQEVQDILNGAAMQTDLTAENERAELAEQTLQGNIDAEALARENADGVLQGHIDDEETRAKAAEKQNADDIDAIEEKIPTQASSSNQLADKDYVEDLVSTSSATFRGTFNLVSDLHLTVDASHADIAAALGNAIAGADNNDFAFVMIPTSVDTPNEIARIERYKFNGTAWAFEFVLNNSGFTADQWAAINSGITSALVTKLGALPTASELATALLAKQDKLTFDSAPTPGSNNPVTSGGIYTAIDNEKMARQNVDGQIQQAIEAILALIPSAATALNQLADKAFVNSSIATATATFRGTFNLVSDLQLTVDATHADIAAALLNAISTADNNDYAFVQIPTSVDTPTEIRVTERYKFNGTAWSYEYDLNNSGFTADQWAAINSGITTLLVTKLSNLPNATELAALFAGKQNVLTFDNAPVNGSDNPVKSGGLYDLFAAIDAKMPTGASANNKLVAEDRLAAYVGGIIGALDATFNLTSTDGHVTLRMTQTDGVIASLQILTSDIASASALATLGGLVSTNADDIAALQALYNALQQSAPQIIEPSDTWPVANPSDTVIYRVIDRVNTPPQYYSDYMWNGTAMVLMAQYNNAIDSVPTHNSNNLVKSGGVYPLTRLYNAPQIVLGAFEDGYALFFNGTSAIKQATSGNSITQFSVEGGRRIHLENFDAVGARSICVYDSNDNLLDCIITQSSNISIDYVLPETASYVIATVETTLQSQFYAEYVYPITEDLQKIKNDVEAKYNSIEAEIDDLYERELSLGTIIQGKYVVWYGADTPVNGTEITDSDCICTDFIPVKTGFKVKMSGLWLKDNRSVCAYDKDKQFVEGVIRNTQVISEYEYTIPSGVAYIRMSGKVGQDLSAVYIDHPITKDIERLEKEIDLSFGNIYGKKWLFLGDSITHESFKTDHPEYGWVTHFQNYVKAAKIVNVSVDGAHWKDYADTGDYDGNPQYANLSQNVIGNQCEKIIRGKDTTNPNYSYVEDYQDFDFIIVAAGTNDGDTTANDTTYFDEQFGHYENSEWVKTPLANVNRQLFPGIMRYVYEKFTVLYPNARIFYCTPVQAFYGSRSYEGIMNIGDMIKKVCSRLSDVTAVDTEKCGIYGNFEFDDEMGRDLYDGLHTNENGGKKIAKYNYCAIKDSVSGY